MADDTRLNAGSGGDLIATDEISGGVADGAKVQRIKVGIGTDGAYADAGHAANPIVVQLGDGTTEAEIDPLGYLTTIDIEHHKVHEGKHFFLKTWQDVGQGNTVYFMFRTPNTSTRIHARAHIAGEVEFTIGLYENPTLTADGTPVTMLNNDRNSANTPSLLAFSGPTVTDDGTPLRLTKIGSNRDDTVSPGANYEIIAKQNEEYLFKITNDANTTGWIDVDFWYYEVD